MSPKPCVTQKPSGRQQDRRGRKQDRSGRKQDRSGRKQDRSGRKQDRSGDCRDRRVQKKMKGLNVQKPWARALLEGTKTVEVRTYPLGKKGFEIGVDYCVTETCGKADLAREVGTVRFKEEFEYANLDAFRNDEHRHCIPEGSPYDWQLATTPKLYGWVVDVARPFVKPIPPPAKRGMIGSKATRRRATYAKRLDGFIVE